MDVTRRRLGDVAERLLGGRKRWDPPPDWTCWSEPAPVRPIDRAITALRQSNREPRLRRRGNPRCAQHCMPVLRARAMRPRWPSTPPPWRRAIDPADMVKRWRAHEHAARDARASIAAIAQSLVEAEKIPYSRWPLLEPPEVDREYSKISNELLLRLEERCREGGFAHKAPVRESFLCKI